MGLRACLPYHYQMLLAKPWRVLGFAAAIATCGEALDLALDGSDSDRSLIAEALSQVCASQAAVPILDSARAPTAPSATRMRVVAAAARREENFAYPASFAHLCAFCCVCAALEDAAADELAQAKRKSDRGAFEAERAYRDLVRAPPQTKEECLDWIDELHACGALSEGTCGSMAEAIPRRKASVATVLQSAGFECDADACATYEALHEDGIKRLPRTDDRDDAAVLLYALILAALDEARPAFELQELVRTTAAEAGAPDLYRPHKVQESEAPEEEEEDEEPSQELLLVRAFPQSSKGSRQHVRRERERHGRLRRRVLRTGRWQGQAGADPAPALCAAPPTLRDALGRRPGESFVGGAARRRRAAQGRRFAGRVDGRPGPGAVAGALPRGDGPGDRGTSRGRGAGDGRKAHATT